MKRTAALLALVAALAVAGGSSPVAAAEPTLGATLSPTVLVFERGREVAITNRSTLPVTVAMSIDGGWSIEPATVDLDPGERATFEVSGEGGPDALVRAVLTPVEPLPGVERTSLVLQATARHAYPWEGFDFWPVVLLALLFLVLGGLTLARHRRDERAAYQARLERRFVQHAHPREAAR